MADRTFFFREVGAGGTYELEASCALGPSHILLGVSAGIDQAGLSRPVFVIAHKQQRMWKDEELCRSLPTDGTVSGAAPEVSA